MKDYKVKEIFFSLAGEGAQVGRATVFVRFSGCNLWSGREEDRLGAKCDFCDTDFTDQLGPNGGRYSLGMLVDRIVELWGPLESSGKAKARPYVVFTGGEPSLQLDEALLLGCKKKGFETGIETNGTRALPEGIDWICVSPKGSEPLVVKKGQELKLVFPQLKARPEAFCELDFDHYFLQPLFSESGEHWQAAAKYCLEHPQWRLSLQIHKLLGLS